MLAVRKTSRAFRPRRPPLSQPGNRKILAYLRSSARTPFCASPTCRVRRSRRTQSVGIQWGMGAAGMLGASARRFAHRRVAVPADYFGLRFFYWFRLTTDAEAPAWHEQVVSIDERPVAGAVRRLSSLFSPTGSFPGASGIAEKTRLQFETDTLPRYIETQRWYAGEGHRGGPRDRSQITCCGR